MAGGVDIDPYSAPAGDLEPEDLEAQHGADRLVGAGGAVAAAAGLLMLATSWQLSTMLVFRYDWQEAWVYAIGCSGAVALVSGAGFTQARKWAIYPSFGACTLGALLTWGWVVYVFFSGGFTLVSFVGAGVATVGALLTGLGMGMAKRVAAARDALYRDAG